MGKTMENSEKRETNEELERYLESEAVGTPQPGEVRRCTVIQSGTEYVVVDLAAKMEGVINKRDLVRKPQTYKPGEVINAVVTSYNSEEEGRTYLSEKRYAVSKLLKEFKQNGVEHKIIKGRVTRKVRGGYNVEIDGVLSSFLPGSQASSFNNLSPSELTEKEYDFEVITFEERDRGRYNIVLSRDVIVDQKKKEFLDGIDEDQKIKGIVRDITNFGVFVDVGEMTALLPKSEVTWDRNVNLKEKFRIGSEIEAVVISKDPENGKMSISTKRLTEDPWKEIETRYPVGKIVDAVVTGIAPYGIFVKIEEGIKGLVRSSEIFWGNFRRNLKDYFEEGQKVQVEVIDIDTAKRRISFSIKSVNGDPWEGIEERFRAGEIVEAKVAKILDNGAIMEIEEGISGFSHISELSWNFVKNPSDVIKKGQEIDVQILEINPETRRIRLSIKRTTEDPWSKLSREVQVGTPVDCEIISIKNSGAIVRVTDYDVEGFLPKSQFVGDLKEGEVIKAKVHKVSYNPKIDERDMVVTLKDNVEETSRTREPRDSNNDNRQFMSSGPMTSTIGDLVNQKSEEQD